MQRLKRFFSNLLREDRATDLVSYSLLLAFVCLASGAMYVHSGGSVKGIWTTANSVLTSGNLADGSGGGDLSGAENGLWGLGNWGAGFGNEGNAFSEGNINQASQAFQNWFQNQNFAWQQANYNQIIAWGQSIWGGSWSPYGF